MLSERQTSTYRLMCKTVKKPSRWLTYNDTVKSAVWYLIEQDIRASRAAPRQLHSAKDRLDVKPIDVVMHVHMLTNAHTWTHVHTILGEISKS